jgi:hypothetical protein
MSDWSTTFYFEQELRSSYMNSLTMGLIKPGIYNANAYISTKDSTTPGEQGIYLHIKEGTILVFSNSYDIIGGNAYRNMNRLGSYVVKCVANQDIAPILIAKPNQDFSQIFELDGLLRTVAPTIFVYASFVYNENAAGNITPNFRLAVPSSNPNFAGQTDYFLPTEGQSLSGSADTKISYLILGTLIDTQVLPQIYVDGADWKRTAGVYDGDVAWKNNHIFTARGLPEYSAALSRNYGVGLSTIIFGEKYNRAYFTSGQFYNNSILYQIDGRNWRNIYGQNSLPDTTAPTSASGAICDHIYANKDTAAYTYSNPASLLIAGNANKLLIEIVFLAAHSEYAKAQPQDLTTLLNASSDFTVSRKILPIRLLLDGSSVTSMDTRTCLGTAMQAPNITIVPLDISTRNIERLKSILVNKNILMPVVDMLRQQAQTASPFLDPSIGQTLIPIMITFRKINSAGTNFDDPCSAAVLPVCDNLSACNPANILSFFELQSSGYSIMGTALTVQEAYETLPFLD